MALKGSSGFLVDVNHNPVWIAWEVHANLNLDLGHLFIDFRLSNIVRQYNHAG